MQIELTEDEAYALWAVIYGTVGGSPKGPRRLFESIADKLAEHIEVYRAPHRYTAIIENVGRESYRPAVVVRKTE